MAIPKVRMRGMKMTDIDEIPHRNRHPFASKLGMWIDYKSHFLGEHHRWMDLNHEKTIIVERAKYAVLTERHFLYLCVDCGKTGSMPMTHHESYKPIREWIPNESVKAIADAWGKA